MPQSAVAYLPKSVIEVKLNITTDEIEKYYEKSLADLVKTTPIHGFRKGKAPHAMVEAYIGKEQIYEKAINTLITSEFEQALREEQKKNNQRIMLLENPKYNIDEKWQPGESMKITVRCAIYPKVDISKVMQEIQVERKQPQDTSEADIETAIEKMFEQYKKIKEKEAEEKSKNLLKNKERQKKSAENKEETEKQEIKIEKDDTFARAAGAQNMQELKELVRREIEEEKARIAERMFEEEVVNQAQKYIEEIDIPDILINEELSRIEKRFITQLQRIGVTLAKYLEIENKNKEDIINEWYERARENTIIALILQQIRIDNNIQVTQEEVNMFTRNNITSGKSKEVTTREQEGRNTIAYIIGQTKALHELKKRAQQNAERKKRAA